MFRQVRSQKGLTLVELMVVVAIIAIIAAVAITVFQDIQKKAKLAADQGNVAAMRSAVAIYYGKNNGIFPGAVAAVRGPGDAGPDLAVRHAADVHGRERQGRLHRGSQRLPVTVAAARAGRTPRVVTKIEVSVVRPVLDEVESLGVLDRERPRRRAPRSFVRDRLRG